MRLRHRTAIQRLVVGASLSAVMLGGATACASSDDDGTATQQTSASSTPEGSDSPSSTPSETETEQVVEIRVSVTDGRVRPAPRRIEIDKDSQVRLLVTSDVDDSVHLHGYEVEAELEAGRPTTVEFAADQSGLFEVETHDTELELLQLEVR